MHSIICISSYACAHLSYIFSGKLLADVAHDHKAHVGDRSRKMPSIEDLLKDLERENIAETAFDAGEGEKGTASEGNEAGEGEDGEKLKYKTFDADGE